MSSRKVILDQVNRTAWLSERVVTFSVTREQYSQGELKSRHGSGYSECACRGAFGRFVLPAWTGTTLLVDQFPVLSDLEPKRLLVEVELGAAMSPHCADGVIMSGRVWQEATRFVSRPRDRTLQASRCEPSYQPLTNAGTGEPARALQRRKKGPARYGRLTSRSIHARRSLWVRWIGNRLARDYSEAVTTKTTKERTRARARE